jgi:PAS domain S-box-containing protein
MADQPTYQDLLAKVEELAESLERYRSLTKNASDLLYRTDKQGKITYISSSVFGLSGYTVEEAIGMNMAEEVYLNPQERDNFLHELRIHGKVNNFEAQLKRKDGTVWWASTNAHFFKNQAGEIAGVEGITRDITELKLAQEAQNKLINELQEAIDEVQTLSGLLPICSSCKKIRDDKGYWNQIESYLQKHARAEFSHSLCPECTERLYGDEKWYAAMLEKHEN